MSAKTLGPVATEMHTRLTLALAPTHLIITDDSEAHRGHAGHNGAGESHFTVELSAAAFAGQNRVVQQRLVYAALGDLMTTRIHALVIKAG